MGVRITMADTSGVLMHCQVVIRGVLPFHADATLAIDDVIIGPYHVS